jgi:hypothetical protein
MDNRKISLKRAGAGIIVVLVLLLGSAVSWGDTSIYVYQALNSGALTIKTIDCNGTTTTPAQTVAIPNSCFTPDLFWDSANGALRLNGFDSNNYPIWTGTIDATGKFATTMAPLTVTCGSAVASVVNAAFPTKCTGYSAWTACSGGVMTRTGTTPSGCVPDQPTILSCTPACTSWIYGSWTPASCAGGSIQNRTATGSPAGCVGMPDQVTVQSCPPQACTSYSYTLGPCQSNNTAPVVSYSGIPSGCSGGATPAQTQQCVYNAPTCTSWTYSAWSPSETSCTSGQTLTRSILTSSPTPCNGGNPILSEACPNGPSSPPQGTALSYYAINYHMTLPANGTLLFNAAVGSPNCTSTSRASFSVSAQQQSPRTDILVKKSFNFTASPPTKADYNNFFAQTGVAPGQYYSITSNGSFFWNFSGSGSGETVLVNPSNLTRLGVTGFDVLDTYYMLLVNTSTSLSSDVYIQYYCY